MGPKFNDTQYFEEDGTLEVCGPTNFGPDDIALELTEVTVIDRKGNEGRTAPHLHLRFRAGEMWEADIPNARGHLVPGMARGLATGIVTKRHGPNEDIQWPGRFEIMDPKTFLTSSDDDE